MQGDIRLLDLRCHMTTHFYHLYRYSHKIWMLRLPQKTQLSGAWLGDPGSSNCGNIMRILGADLTNVIHLISLYKVALHILKSGTLDCSKICALCLDQIGLDQI